MSRLKSVWRGALLLIVSLATLPLVARFVPPDRLIAAAGFDLVTKERTGIEYTLLLRELLGHLEEYQADSVSRRGLDDQKEHIRQFREVDATIHSLTEADERLGGILRRSDKWKALTRQWDALQEQGPSVRATPSVAALIAINRSLIVATEDSFDLANAPALERYHDLAGVTTKLRQATDDLIQIKALGETAVAHKAVTAQDRARLSKLSASIKSVIDLVDRSTHTPSDGGRSLRAEIGTSVEDCFIAAHLFLDLVDSKILKDLVREVDSAEFGRAGTQAIDASANLYHDMIVALDALVQARFNELSTRQTVARSIALAPFAIVPLLMLAVYRFLRRSVSAARRALRRSSAALQPIKSVPPIADSAPIAAAETVPDEPDHEFRDVFENSPVGMALLATDGGWLRVNRALCGIVGYSADALMKVAPDQIVHADDLQAYHAHIQRLLAGESRVSQFDQRYLHRLGHAVWATLSMSLLRDPGGQARCFIVLIHDISERKRTEAALRAAKDAAENTSRVGHEFLACMGQQIRPATTVIEMAQSMLDTPMPPVQRQRADAIRQAGETLLSALTGLIGPGETASDQQPVAVVEFAVQAAIEEVAEPLTKWARSKRLDVSCVVEPDVPATLRGDPTRLRQVLIQLVGNAIKFTQQGVVVIRITCDDVSAESILLHAEVSDTGKGIAPDELARLLDSLAETDSAEAPSGRGLAICRRLVEQMGGELGAQSELGRGSTFWFTARCQPVAASLQSPRPTAGTRPVRVVAKPAPRRDGEVRSASAAVRVLVADGNPADHRLLVRMLERLGYAADTVSNGAAAVDATRRTRYALLLIAPQLLEMDGFAATGAIRALEAEKVGAEALHVPIIGLIDGATQDEHAHCLTAGMDDALAKPIKVDALRGLVQRWLNSTTPRNTSPATGTPPESSGAEVPAESPPAPALDRLQLRA